MARSKKRLIYVIPLTIFYSCMWFACLLIIVGFFMPTPVVFAKKLNGTYRKRQQPQKPVDSEFTTNNLIFYDIVDDD